MSQIKSTFRGIEFCAYSPDGQQVVSGAEDGSIKIWDVVTGREIKTLLGHSDQLAGCVFFPDGQRILSGALDGTLKVWDSEEGQEIITLKGHANGITSIAISPNGRRIISGSVDRTLKIWDAESGEEICTLRGHTNRVNAVAMSPDACRIISGSEDTSIKIWDFKTGEELATILGHSKNVTACLYSPDNQTIISGALDGKIKMWDAENGQEICTLAGHTEGITSVAVSPDAKHIISSSHDAVIKIWDVDTGREFATLQGHSKSVNSCIFSPDGEHILSASNDGMIKIWDAQTGEELATLFGHLSFFVSTIDSKLPRPDELALQVDYEAFFNIINPDLSYTARKDLAKAIHEYWRQLGKREGWINHKLDKDFKELPEDLKEDNRAAAARMLQVLDLVGLYIVPKSFSKAESKEDVKAIKEIKEIEEIIAIIEQNLELLAEAEHNGWMEQKLKNGWSYGKDPDEKKKKHRCLVEWEKLSEKDKDSNRGAVREIPKILAQAGFKIYRLNPPIQRDGGSPNKAKHPVICTVFAPPSAPQGGTLFVQVFAHMPESSEEAEELAIKSDEETKWRNFKWLETEIDLGTKLMFSLSIPGLNVDDPVQELVWRSKTESVQFGVNVPENRKPGAVVGKVTISQNSVPAGHIKFILRITQAEESRFQEKTEPVGDDARRYEKAFISYASKDRKEVVKRVQGLRISRYIKFFKDVLHLDPGDRWEQKLYRHIDECDLFLLFWSRNAKKSKWVMEEVRYALRRKAGDEFAPPEILPVILERPSKAEPPEELAHLHFNDSLLFFM